MIRDNIVTDGSTSGTSASIGGPGDFEEKQFNNSNSNNSGPSMTTTDVSPSDYGTIDLGNSGPGGGQNFEMGKDQTAKESAQKGYAAGVETSQSVENAGGPGNVLTGSQDQVKTVNNVVSEATKQIADNLGEDSPAAQKNQQNQQNQQKPLNQENQPHTMNVPSGTGGPDGLLGEIIAFFSSLFNAVFGGN